MTEKQNDIGSCTDWNVHSSHRNHVTNRIANPFFEFENKTRVDRRGPVVAEN